MKPEIALCLFVGAILIYGSIIIGLVLLMVLIIKLIYNKIKGYKMIKNPYYLLLIVSDGKEICRILTDEEFQALDTGKIYVKYQLRSTLEHCKRELEQNGWQQTIL